MRSTSGERRGRTAWAAAGKCMGPDGDGACPHEGHRDGNMRLCVACQKDKASRLSRPCKGWQEGGCPRHSQARLRGKLCNACNKAKWRAKKKE